MSTSRTIIGLTIIALGVLMFGQQFHWWFVSFERWWPIFVLLPGLGFFVTGVKRAGALIPATTLTILGLYFMFEVWTNWSTATVTAFIYPLSVGLGFLLTAERSTKGASGLRFVMWILFASAAVTLISALGQTRYWPILLIMLGVALILRPRDFLRQRENVHPTSETTGQ
jgi:hypothetical protein